MAKHSTEYLNKALWGIMVALEQAPCLFSALPRSPRRCRLLGTVRRAVDLDLILGDMELPDPWLMLAQKGRSELARVRALPRLPLYAGGDAPFFARKPKVMVEDAPTTITPQVPLLLPAPASECIASVLVSLSVPITIMVAGHIDAQSIASLVAKQVELRGVQGFLVGWRINSVLHGETILADPGQG